MTAVVQPDLGPPPAHKYKDDPSDDPLRHLGSNHNQRPHSLQQHPRPAGLLHQHNQRPESPHQHSTASLPPGPYSAAPALHSIHLQHPPPYPAPTQDPSYYAQHSNQYPTTTTPTQYTSSAPDLMAATSQMQRPYPPIYHTTQANSPASVAPTQAHDQHGRSLYAQSPQIPSQMYGYQPYSSINSVHPAYNPQPPASQHPLTTQSLMMPPQAAPAHQPSLANASTNNSSPRSKMEPVPQPQQHTPVQAQRPSITMPAPVLTSPSTSIPPLSTNGVHINQSNSNTNQTSAAPGPIPATTPQLVRQDSNGVQWIAFEYSRDRVKMEYTIRCDVESVNVEGLPQEFKTENCVYPRACCSKEQYRGNRLIYETECNAVGWALAQLNPPLRGKRGLIQRAVDSWRNSNQDPRLRSRRVRRMAKINRRQTNHHSSQQLGTNNSVPHLLTQSPSTMTPAPRSGASLPLVSPLQHHAQHHAQHQESQAGNEEVSGSTHYSNGAYHSSYVPTSAKPSISGAHGNAPDIRTGNVFHGVLPYPGTAQASGGLGGPSLAPALQGSGFNSLPRNSVAATSHSRQVADERYETESSARNPGDKLLFGNLPVGKRRKFILIDDHQRGGRARVKVTLDKVDVNEIPDSYRLSNAVFPRAYYPVQMKDSPGRTVPDNRYFEGRDNDEDDEDVDDNYDDDNGSEPVTIGRTIVPFSSEGLAAPVPQLSRRRHQRDKVMNDIGYRMSWSQSRVFASRHLFLQRSVDAYRNKMRGSMLTMDEEPSSIAPHFETRIGKRKFNDRRKRNRNNSAYLREAEEVEA